MKLFALISELGSREVLLASNSPRPCETATADSKFFTWKVPFNFERINYVTQDTFCFDSTTSRQCILYSRWPRTAWKIWITASIWFEYLEHKICRISMDRVRETIHTASKIRFIYSQKWKWVALFPVSTFMFLWAIYLFPWSVCLF